MAEGKFLSALAALGSDLDTTTTDRFALDSLARLRESAATLKDARASWGLGFVWGEAPATDAFVVTTALVAQGLLDISEVAGPDVAGEARKLHGQAINWLTSGSTLVRHGRATLPVYGSSNPQPVRNVVATWAGIVTNSPVASPRDKRIAKRAAEWVLRSYMPDLGWAYSETSTRVDLLHTCYIVNGLLSAVGKNPVAERATAALLTFDDLQGWRDKWDAFPRQQVFGGELATVNRDLRVVGQYVVAGLNVPARSWSLGELLLAAARMAPVQSVGALWCERLPAVVRQIADRFPNEDRPRHAMHLAHGLAVAARWKGAVVDR